MSKQPTDFSISHLERHGIARLITAWPPVEAEGETDRRRWVGGGQQTAEDELTNCLRNLILSWR